MSRRLAREKAIQALYQVGISQVSLEAAIESVVNEPLNKNGQQDKKEHFIEKDLEFLEQLVQGTMEHQESIDERLRPYMKDWRLERLSVIDRGILRMAVFEIFYLGIPHPIAMDEAVELTKRFSTEESKSFVNGILSRMVSEQR